MKPRLLVVLLALLAVACSKPNDNAEIDLNIDYEVNGKHLVIDTLCYVNEAGNKFLITEIQWFLSNIEFQDERGGWHILQHQNDMDVLSLPQDRIFYFDTNITKNQTIGMGSIPIGKYTTIRFTFGLNEVDNQTGLFTDPPESDMFWPDMLGGGYHYMKLNGKYLDTEGRLTPLAIHLGIGQNEDCTEFYQNYFTIELPIDFNVASNTKNQLDLTMVIDNWFRNPHTIDFDEFGSHIMQNQTAQYLLSCNGKDVFRIGKPTENKNNTNMEKDNRIAEKFKIVMQKAAPKPHFWSWESVKERIENSKIQDSKI